MNYIVEVPSAISHRMCLLGHGPTKAAALEDAYGPKDSWGPSTQRSVKNAQIRQVSDDELADLQTESANA